MMFYRRGKNNIIYLSYKNLMIFKKLLKYYYFIPWRKIKIYYNIMYIRKSLNIVNISYSIAAR